VHIAAKHFNAIAGVATALIMAVSQVNAQTATFTLPFATHVGKTTLPAGEYRLQVSAMGSVIPAAYLYANGKLVATAPVFRQLTQDATGSYLELLAVGGSHYFNKFVSRDAGATYTFVIPSAAQHQIFAETRATKISTDRGQRN
jgi:hypothetical protein